MSDSYLDYDFSIICDDDPKSRKTAAFLKRKLSAFHYSVRMEYGGAAFCPGQVTEANFNTCFDAILRSKKLIAILSRNTGNSSAARAAAFYSEQTGRKTIRVCSDISSLKKAKDLCPFEVEYTRASLTGSPFFHSDTMRLKSELAERKWNPVKQRLIRLCGILSVSVVVLATLLLTFGWIVHKEEMDEELPGMDVKVLLSQTKWTRGNFISPDGEMFGDMQMDGKLLIRKSADNTIVQTLDTPFANEGANILFTKDNRSVIVYNSDRVLLYSMEENKELFRLPVEHGSCQGAYLINQDKWIGIRTANADNETTKVTVWDSETGGLLYSYTDQQGFFFLGFTLDGSRIVGRKGENYMWTWDFANRKETYNAEAVAGVEGMVDSPPFSPDGKYYLDSDEYMKNFSKNTVTDMKVISCRNGSILSQIHYEGWGFGKEYFDQSGRLLVVKPRFFAIYDPYSGSLSTKIPVIRNNYFTIVRLIKDTRYAFCCTRDPSKGDNRVYAVDTMDGSIKAQTFVKERIEEVKVFPETGRILTVTDPYEGRSAYLFEYRLTADGIEFE